MEHDVCALECTRELICVAQRAGQPGHALERRIVIPCTTIDPYDRTKCQELGTQIRPQEATATNDGTGQATQRTGSRHCPAREAISAWKCRTRSALDTSTVWPSRNCSIRLCPQYNLYDGLLVHLQTSSLHCSCGSQHYPSRRKYLVAFHS